MARKVNRRKITAMISLLVVFVAVLGVGVNMLVDTPDESVTDDSDDSDDAEDTDDEPEEEIGEFQAHMINVFSGCYEQEFFHETRMDYGNGTFYINITVDEDDRERRVGDSADCTEEYFGNLNFSVNLTFYDLDDQMYQALYMD